MKKPKKGCAGAVSRPRPGTPACTLHGCSGGADDEIKAQSTSLGSAHRVQVCAGLCVCVPVCAGAGVLGTKRAPCETGALLHCGRAVSGVKCNRGAEAVFKQDILWQHTHACTHAAQHMTYTCPRQNYHFMELSIQLRRKTYTTCTCKSCTALVVYLIGGGKTNLGGGFIFVKGMQLKINFFAVCFAVNHTLCGELIIFANNQYWHSTVGNAWDRSLVHKLLEGRCQQRSSLLHICLLNCRFPSAVASPTRWAHQCMAWAPSNPS